MIRIAIGILIGSIVSSFAQTSTLDAIKIYNDLVFVVGGLDNLGRAHIIKTDQEGNVICSRIIQ